MSLILQNVHKSFYQGEKKLEILKGVSFHAKPGETLAILGQSGSGKSTLLSLLAGLDRPDSGEIKFGDTQLSKLNEEEMTNFRARNIGIVFQQFHLIQHLTALENVMVPLEILGQLDQVNRARELLISMGLEHRLDHLPGKLSGGECQRVAIARALIAAPKIILADEPSGNLDSETGAQVMDVFFKLAASHNAIKILVTHSPDLADRCDRQLFLRAGII